MNGPDANDSMLLAEQIAVLTRGAARGHGASNIVETWIIGALVAELVVAGHVAVTHTAGHRAVASLAVTDRGSTGHDVLDEALALLAAEPSGGAGAAARWRPARMSGRRARRHLAAGGAPRPTDVAYWWFGSWRCAEFPQLPPTLVVQLLRLQESLDRPVLRVLERLKARGAVTEGWEVDPIACRDASNIVRAAVIPRHQALEPRIAHVVALRSLRSAWLDEDIGGPRQQRHYAQYDADALFERLPVAGAVKAITRAHDKMLDWWDDC
jgi:hypothetical protein